MKNTLNVLFLSLIIVFTMAACEKYSPLDISIYPAAPQTPVPFNDITASELVSNIRVGWNLGNTLDTADLTWLAPNADVYYFETAWGNPIATEENIVALKNAGFNTIRIPVSWAKAADSDYNIREDWMERVVEVVNYVIDNDMYAIINTHHDESIFKFLDSDMEESEKAFQKIWEQIAGVFRNYSEKLIFEGLNEPRTKGSANEWNGGTVEEINNLNTYYTLFVKTVRKSGGNNDKRILMINPYGASGEILAINNLKVPDDTAKNKIVVSIHSYSPYNFALNKSMSYRTWSKDSSADVTQIKTPIDRAYTKFVSNGIPVIMGEFGAMNKDNEDARKEWAEFYVSYAKEKGIPCIWWDNGVTTGEDSERFGLLDRWFNDFSYPEIVAALMRGSEVPAVSK